MGTNKRVESQWYKGSLWWVGKAQCSGSWVHPGGIVEHRMVAEEPKLIIRYNRQK